MKLRIIDDAAHSPALNMAADEYLLEACPRLQTVFVRLYEWDPPTISIGRMQKADEILEFCAMQSAGAAWIRRPTGGRAVLHDGDITYSCIFPVPCPAMGKTVMDTYAVISRCLLSGLAYAGIRCRAHDSFDRLHGTRREVKLHEVKLPCFLSPNRKEIMADGKKLIGSAQKRTSQAVLQHGTIPLSGAYRRLPDYLRLPDNQRAIQKRLLVEKSACLKEIAPSLTMDGVRQALIKGFSETLPFEAKKKSWSGEELEMIKERESEMSV